MKKYAATGQPVKYKDPHWLPDTSGRKRDETIQPHRLMAPALVYTRAPRALVDFASIDFETRSTTDLRKAGQHIYFEDPNTDILCLAWAINDEPVRPIWYPGLPFPKDLRRHIEKGRRINAWNAIFERLAWTIMVKKYKAPEILLEQFHCTMVRALACAFPGALEKAANALRIEERKDIAGAKAMVKLSKPRRKRDGTFTWWSKDEWPGLYTTMYEYCRQDVKTERACGAALPDLPPSEWRQYWFDQRVADRGILIDQKLCRSAIQVVKQRQAELKEECIKLVGVGPSQPVPYRAWINKELVGFRRKDDVKPLQLPDLKAVTVDTALRIKDLPRRVRRALVLRREGGRSSTVKYSAALNRLSRDGTAKGARQFYGAHTGRWSGRGVNFDNLKRVEMKVDPDELVSVIGTSDADLVESVYGSVLEPVSNAVRSMLVADEGEELYVADFKSIESRLLAETSGQQSTNDRWRLSDQGKGPDVYVFNGAGLFGVKIDKVTKEIRYWGKIAELLLGYQGATRPLLAQQDKANIYFREIYRTLLRTASSQAIEKVEFLYKKIGEGDPRDWKAARLVVEDWRARNPMTTLFWRMVQRCAVYTVRSGKPVQYRGIKFHYDQHFKMLVITTLSGRNLYYPFAEAVQVKNYKEEAEWVVRAYYQRDFGGQHLWTSYHPYGGLFTENIVQNEARDVMAGRFRPLEKLGFKVIHTVHDELISKMKRPSGLSQASALKLYEKTIAVSPKWAPNCPIAAEAWSGLRYKKSE